MLFTHMEADSSIVGGIYVVWRMDTEYLAVIDKSKVKFEVNYHNQVFTVSY